MPLTTVESDELAVFNTRDRLGARVTLLGEQEAVAKDAVRCVFDRRELFSTDRCVTVGALEALAVPRSASEHHPGLGDRVATFCALLTVLSLVAWHTDHLITSRYETRRADLLLTYPTRKALGMPLPSSMFVFLHTGPEDGTAERAARREVILITRCAMQPIKLVRKR